MKVVVVIPTYNEADNVSRLLPMLQEEFSQITNHEMHALIVDGNSTDRTQEIVLGFANQNNWTHLMVEKEKEGLGAAYVKGFRKAIKELNADVVMEMDADLQHDPRDIKRFVAEIDKGADYVLGSRYVPGGSVPKEWAGYRKLLSIGGSIFARAVLGMWDVKDFTTGFKATRVKGVLDQIDLDEIMSAGFAYKIDLLFRTHRLGAKIVEIPINFGLRDRGDSKMEQSNFMDSLKVVIRLRMNESKSFIKFLVVGTIGATVDFVFANLLKLENVQGSFAASTAALIAMMTTFALNNIWSFNQKRITGSTKIFKKFVPYIGLSTIPIIFRFFFVGFMESMFGTSYLVYNISIVISIGIGLFWNYFSYSRFIWGTKAKKKQEEEISNEKSEEEEVQERIKAKLAEIKQEKEEAVAKATQEQEPASTNVPESDDLDQKVEEKMKEIRGE